MFGEFVWWQGVVEDRLDPLMLGRCRVRILGYHTDNKVEGVGIPTNHLPWATPSQPITSAAMNGIGTTPMGPVEGTWVFGFFRDGENAQEPVMMSTFGGIPEKGADTKLGFNDPSGKYPRAGDLNIPDTHRLATGDGHPVVGTENGEDAESLRYKRKSRHKRVPTALAGDMSTSIPHTDDSALYETTLWNEPNPRYGGTEISDTKYLDSIKMSSVYPFNHVRMSESGHVEEWDDTEDAERLHRYHRKGTFEEIQPDGTRVVKVVANDYEIVIGNKDVLISGACNVTIEGDCRMLYQGSLVQEVYGDYHLNVHGDKRTKITGNEVTEVLADRKTVVNGNDDLYIAFDQILNIGDDRTINIGSAGKKQDGVTDKTGNCSETITGTLTEITHGTMFTMVNKNTTMVTSGNIDITSIGDMGLSTNANFNHTVTSNSTHQISGSSTINVSGNSSINVGGTFQKKLNGAAFEHYASTLDERHDSVYKVYTGSDVHSYREGGTDYANPVQRGSSEAAQQAQGV